MRGNCTLRALESYGLETPDGARSVVLVHGGRGPALVARVGPCTSGAGAGYEVYQFSSRRIPDALFPLSAGEAG